MNYDIFIEDCPSSVVARFRHEVEVRAGRQIRWSIERHDTISQVLGRSFSIEYSQDGPEYWNPIIERFAAIEEGNDNYPEEEPKVAMTRSTRKYKAFPLWARMLDNNKHIKQDNNNRR